MSVCLNLIKAIDEFTIFYSILQATSQQLLLFEGNYALNFDNDTLSYDHSVHPNMNTFYQDAGIHPSVNNTYEGRILKFSQKIWDPECKI